MNTNSLPTVSGGMATTLPPPVPVTNSAIDGDVTICPTAAGITSRQLVERYGYQIISFIEGDSATPKQILSKHLATLLDVIPIMEAELKQKPHMGTVYALTNLMEHTRAVLADINAQVDVDEIVDVLDKQILQDMIVRLLSIISEKAGPLKSVLTSMIKPEYQSQLQDVLNDFVRSIGVDLKGLYTDSRKMVSRAVQEGIYGGEGK